MDETKASSTRKHKATPQIAPAEVTDESREDEATEEDEGAVPAVLPPHDFILAQVAHIGNAGLATVLNKHPADVGPPEALVSVVRVERRVGVAVVCAVTTRPPLDGTLDGAGAGSGKEVLERLGSVVATVRP